MYLQATPKLFDGPDLQEAMRNTDREGNTISSDLEPETGSNAEAGISTIFRGLTTEDDSLQLSGKYFVTDLENWISCMKVVLIVLLALPLIRVHAQAHLMQMKIMKSKG